MSNVVTIRIKRATDAAIISAIRIVIDKSLNKIKIRGYTSITMKKDRSTKTSL